MTAYIVTLEVPVRVEHATSGAAAARQAKALLGKLAWQGDTIKASVGLDTKLMDVEYATDDDAGNHAGRLVRARKEQ